MTAFKNLCIVSAVLLCILLLGMSAQYVFMLVLRSQYQKLNPNSEYGTLLLFPDKDLTALIILSTIFVAWTLYCTVAITSLYTEIKNKTLPFILAGQRRDAMAHHFVNNQNQTMAPQDVSIKF